MAALGRMKLDPAFGKERLMGEERREGDKITVGDITSLQGVAIGRNASARVVGSNIWLVAVSSG